MKKNSPRFWNSIFTCFSLTQTFHTAVSYQLSIPYIFIPPARLYLSSHPKLKPNVSFQFPVNKFNILSHEEKTGFKYKNPYTPSILTYMWITSYWKLCDPFKTTSNRTLWSSGISQERVEIFWNSDGGVTRWGIIPTSQVSKWLLLVTVKAAILS